MLSLLSLLRGMAKKPVMYLSMISPANKKKKEKRKEKRKKKLSPLSLFLFFVLSSQLKLKPDPEEILSVVAISEFA